MPEHKESLNHILFCNVVPFRKGEKEFEEYSSKVGARPPVWGNQLLDQLVEAPLPCYAQIRELQGK